LIDRYVKTSPEKSVYDALLLPALNYAERDRQEERLSPDEQAEVIAATRELVSDAADAIRRRAPATASADSPATPADAVKPLKILACPTSGPSDELAIAMLARVTSDLPIQIEVGGSRALASDVIALVQERNIGVVCVVALPPGSTSKSRYLVKRLRAMSPELNIVVCRWAPPEMADQSTQAFRDAGATLVTSTFADTRAFLLTLTSGQAAGSPAHAA
jgi:uncharacterized protein (DUF2384 family)